MSANYNKLRDLLQELFQLDQADLDFGIYRIMNQKRDEIVRFLDNDLLPQVKEAFGHYQSADRAEIQKELDKLVQNITNAGMNPSDSPKVKHLMEKLAENAVDVTALENEVFSHLFNFLNRYYNEGDFISQRRYREGVYAIPYEGEEIKLHWANHDQYYVKSTEYLRDYMFNLPSGKRVRVHLVAASTEQDNKREAPGKERRFFLCDEKSIYEEDGELYIRFEYRPGDAKKRQDALNEESVKRILTTEGFSEWFQELSKPDPTSKNAERTVLEKHLTQYTARNTMDYFIHKDLGSFLRRELDFYIKNEVMHLDDIEHEMAPKVEQYLSQIKVIRKTAGKIIQFLEQLENFQKKLWLKKKFVVETNYCLTLDRVPPELYPEVVANEAQREEWVRLFAIDKIKKDLAQPGYSRPLKIEFLNSHPMLLLDTRFFSNEFKTRLLASIDDLDGSCDGLLVHSDNFQALHLLRKKYEESIKCIYIDPPYNTGSSAILYKNSYRHSSWCALMYDILLALRPLLPDDGAIFVSIDKTERTVLEHALNAVFGDENRVEELIWSMNTNNSQAPNYSTNHEYVEVYAKNRTVAEQDRNMFREPKPGFEEVMGLLAKMNPEYPSLEDAQSALRMLYEKHRIEFRDEIEAQGMEWEDEKTNDPWKGLYNYSHVEYRDLDGRLVAEAEARNSKATLWVWQEDNSSMPAAKQAESTGDPNHPNWRFYRPIHPVTGKACPHPKSGWKFPFGEDDDDSDKRSFRSLDRDGRIAWGADENKVPRIKRMLHEVETNVGKSVFSDYSDGEKETSAMFGRSGIFLAPKHSSFVSRFILHAAKENSVVLDCFGGSGSTAHAVINLNRSDRGKRKYVTVEMGDYFRTVLKPRVLKALYSTDWRGGQPMSHANGLSHCMKYLRLESYEDALNNLELKRTKQQDKVLFDAPEVREQFVLSYMLDVESRESKSLLNVEGFRNPDQYKLKVERNGETQLINVDLVETFNWLLGLTVKHIDLIRGVRVVEGTNPEGERVLVLWRKLDETDNDKLDDWFEKQGYSTRDLEFDLVYVNGDNHLENLKRQDDPTWKVRLIEDEFQRLMFDVQDI